MSVSKKTTLLAVETCTTVCSVGLWNGETIVERVVETARSHSQKILPLCEQVLAEAGIAMSAVDAIACTRGPGAFTGLRIGVGVAKGLAYGQDLPVYAVSSLQVLAYHAMRKHPDASRVAALLDARMGELYYGEYDNCNGLPVLVGKERLTTIAQLNIAGQLFAGTGAQAYAAELRDRGASLSPVDTPLASDIIAIVQTGDVAPVTAATLEPLYLRNKVTY